MIESISSEFVLILASYHIPRYDNNFCTSSAIRRDASQNHRNAYIFQEMGPTYRACMKDSLKKNGKSLTRQNRHNLSLT